MIERLDHFMARANAAYYATHDPFADFVTAPEISQVFGELLGLWAGLVWQMMDTPKQISLVEAGPGRGTLMHDALRAIRRAVPGLAAALSVHLIETSPRLIPVLQSAIPEATIHADLNAIPGGPIIFLANEFLDALPIRQFIRRSSGWAERYVENMQFTDRPTDVSLPDDTAGTIRESGEAAETFMIALAARLTRQGGTALIIDYGPLHSGPGDTLQAIRGTQPANPLAEPGTADLTAHVDFARLVSTAVEAGCRVSGPVPQGTFLASLGIHERTAQLGRGANPDAAIKLMAATRRLTAPEAMGSLFKALALGHPSLPALPGFAA
ncbi:MAG: SAM-dependent methyltransferase [Acidiphilium sp.]|nr:SAM-dependent methyltransferase [Acidiphilium sp.]MDD4934943.1 SAM-dependent methyltransferase [Acidiphilium sp.]